MGSALKIPYTFFSIYSSLLPDRCLQPQQQYGRDHPDDLFGILGYGARKFRYEVAPLVLSWSSVPS
jgi:hypothetical protein